MYNKSYMTTDDRYDKRFLFSSYDSSCLVAPCGNSQMIPPGFYRKWDRIDEISFLPLRIYGSYGVLVTPDDTETVKEIYYTPDWLSGNIEEKVGC